MDKEYKSNSKVNKSAKPNKERKKVEPVVNSGDAKIKKKSIFKRIGNEVIASDAESIGTYLLNDVFIPSFKKAIDEIVHMMLYGEKGSKSNVPGARVSYRDYSRPDNTAGAQKVSRGYAFEDVLLPDRNAAEDVLTGMYGILASYDMVTVSDFYELCGVASKYTDSNYGWINLDNVRAVPVRTGWKLTLPNPRPID